MRASGLPSDLVALQNQEVERSMTGPNKVQKDEKVSALFNLKYPPI